jgi:hypothetical protein
MESAKSLTRLMNTFGWPSGPPPASQISNPRTRPQREDDRTAVARRLAAMHEPDGLLRDHGLRAERARLQLEQRLLEARAAPRVRARRLARGPRRGRVRRLRGRVRGRRDRGGDALRGRGRGWGGRRVRAGERREAREPRECAAGQERGHGGSGQVVGGTLRDDGLA